jgi:small-conductance mechanosensitive channel
VRANRRTGALRQWGLVLVTGAVAIAALVAGSGFGKVTSTAVNPRLVGWISAGVLLVFGVIATTRLSRLLSRGVWSASMPAARGAVRIVTAAVGYLVVLFGVLAILHVAVAQLLVGAGLAGIVLGIAAQQSLGNVFAGIVLVLAKPFHVGDHIRIRSGALGGIFEAWVREMSLTYVTLETDDGEIRVPNSAMLAAGVGRITPAAPARP